MRILAVLALVGLAVAGPVEKRLGVPLEAEDGCNPAIGNATYVADAGNCQVFYICDHGWPKITFCPGNTVWSQVNKHEGQCEDAGDAINDVCGHIRPPPEVIDSLAGTFDPAYSRCQFQCLNAPECISAVAKCDGVTHCSDGSDEVNCAGPCNPSTCRLPNCRCSGTDIPGDLLANEIPQIVTLTWESAVRLEDYNHLLQQILKRIGPNRRREARTNPNGCPITATFFIEHQFTDYAAVQDLYFGGNEIAALSISKSLTSDYWKEASTELWAREIADQRIITNFLGKVRNEDFVGMRAPYLQGGGNRQFDMLQSNGFLYDNSMPTPQMDPPLWPYTLDYRSTQECVILPCPTASYPGLWEVPLVDWLDTNDTLCAEVDNCFFPLSKAESLTLLRSNFARHYNGNRAPFPLHLRARWFYEAHYNIEAMEEFLDELLSMNDVYIVSIDKALQWIMNPTRLNDITRSNQFSCDNSNREPLCAQPITCSYYNITYAPNSIDHQGDRYIETCANTCPQRYPWVANPEGRL